MPLHPQAALAIKQAGDIPANLAPTELRRHYDSMRLPLQAERPRIPRCDEIQILTRSGSIKGRLYTPDSTRSADPLFVYLHGGGWVLGSLEGYETLCRRLAVESGWKVLSVDYRLAPEHKFPAAVEDAHDAVVWAATNAAELGIDPGLIAVGGDSAGANLATVVCHLCARNQGPRLVRQVLIYGAFDLSREYPSHERNASGYMLSRDSLRWFISQYLESPEQRFDWRASPMLANRFDGQPPALCIAAEFDPLVDENKVYADLLRANGVAVEYALFEGMIHPFLSLGGVIDAARKAECLIGTYLRDAAYLSQTTVGVRR